MWVCSIWCGFLISGVFWMFRFSCYFTFSMVGKTAPHANYNNNYGDFGLINRWLLSLSSVNMATKCALVNRHANLVEFTKPFYIHSNQRAHLHGLPIRVRLISKMQLVDNCRYHSCRCRVSWDHVLHIDSPHILDKQMRYSTKQLMQGWWTETVNEQIQNTIS